MTKKKKNKPRCPDPECNSTQIRFKVNGTIVCMGCGKITPPKEEK